MKYLLLFVLAVTNISFPEVFEKNFNFIEHFNLKTNHEFRLKDYVYDKEVKFDKTHFKKEAVFSDLKDRVKFLEPLSFRNAEFYDKTIFVFSQIEKDIDFTGSVFNNGGAYFRNTKFKSSAIFRDAVINTIGRFEMTEFEKSDFTNTVFNGPANFYWAQFKQPQDFSSTVFNDMVSFVEARFYDDVDFSNITFKRFSDFRKCVFNADVKFNSAVLADTLLFEGVKTKEIIDLREAVVKNRCFISLKDSDIESIIINDRFDLIFYVNDTPEEQMEVYERVIKSLEEKNINTDYFGIRYNNIYYSRSKPLLVLGILDMIFWNFGYDKMRVFYWILGFGLIVTYSYKRNK